MASLAAGVRVDQVPTGSRGPGISSPEIPASRVRPHSIIDSEGTSADMRWPAGAFRRKASTSVWIPSCLATCASTVSAGSSVRTASRTRQRSAISKCVNRPARMAQSRMGGTCEVPLRRQLRVREGRRDNA